jgi:hypothetical protein
MAILLLFLALASVAQPIPCEPQFAPLDTGTSSGETELDHWWKDEAGSWAGKNWVGWTHESTRLVPAELIVRPLADRDNLYDEDRVTVEWRPKTLSYAVRCIPWPLDEVSRVSKARQHLGGGLMERLERRGG